MIYLNSIQKIPHKKWKKKLIFVYGWKHCEYLYKSENKDITNSMKYYAYSVRNSKKLPNFQNLATAS